MTNTSSAPHTDADEALHAAQVVVFALATLAELRVINTSCRGHLAERERTGKKQAK